MANQPTVLASLPSRPHGVRVVGTLVFDLVDKDFSVGTNTIVVLGFSFALTMLRLISDLKVQLNKRRHDMMPATTLGGPPLVSGH